MKNTVKLTVLFLLFSLCYSCSPQITRTLTKSYPALNETDSVQVVGIGEEIDFPYEELGTLRIGDNGLGNNCGYDAQLNRLIIEARTVGGNVIKIVEHVPPHWGSYSQTPRKMGIGAGGAYYPCHEFLVMVLRKK